MKSFLALVVCAVIGYAGYLLYVNEPGVLGIESIPPGTAHASMPPVLEYKSGDLGFSFMRPFDSVIENLDNENYDLVTKKQAAKISLATSTYAGTNFSSAVIIIGVSSDPHIASRCVRAASSTEEVATSSKSIDGIIFKAFESKDAAAGNRYDKIAYRTMHESNCYEIVSIIHSTNIDNYPANAVRTFNRESVEKDIDSIISTFKLHVPEGGGIFGKVIQECAQAPCPQPSFLVDVVKNETEILSVLADEHGLFRANVPPGSYELRGTAASSTKCTSVGVVVPITGYISTNIACK